MRRLRYFVKIGLCSYRGRAKGQWPDKSLNIPLCEQIYNIQNLHHDPCWWAHGSVVERPLCIMLSCGRSGFRSSVRPIFFFLWIDITFLCKAGRTEGSLKSGWTIPVSVILEAESY